MGVEMVLRNLRTVWRREVAEEMVYRGGQINKKCGWAKSNFFGEVKKTNSVRHRVGKRHDI